MSFDHHVMEKKWQNFWKKHETFKAVENPDKEKYYVLDMFPYPSGKGLHVGHPKGYISTDIVARLKRAQGYEVLHPMGWDAFGLPAEQYALDTGNDPAEFTAENIETFKKQINNLGFSYDWSREIATTDPEFYKWTQWIFTKLYEKGLAYEDEVPVNWSPDLGTVIANEEVVDGKTERGGHPVYRRPMKQWMLKITEYADRLLDDLDTVDWPESIKEQQRNWIGRSEGVTIDLKVKDSDQVLQVYTTRADTLYGLSYVVISPESKQLQDIVSDDQADAVNEYVEVTEHKSELDRTNEGTEKTGVFTGAYAINPANGEEVPVWTGDYVLASYGTGVVMAVPGHDQRDYEFATKYDLPIKEVIEGGDLSTEAYTGDGEHVNSDFLNGLNNENAIEAMTKRLEEKGLGERTVNYRLRDWVFSRQRYWGEPIPIIHWEDGTTTALSEDQLPLELPKTDNVQPSGTLESPLANEKDWLEVVDPETGLKGRRDTNTMPQWAGSSWYFIRFADPKNSEELIDKENLDYWMNVDLYVGGAEHAVLHLLYARFWHKFLYDIGVVNTKEPFQKLVNQGMILGENNEKMSKSRGNTVNPDDIISEYGADALRVYEMFMGPVDSGAKWTTEGIAGSRHFLDRVWRMIVDENGDLRDRITTINNGELDVVYNQTVKKVTEDFEGLRFNTAISQLMIFVNEAYKVDSLPFEYMKGFVQLLAPIAPHISEELWQRLTNNNDGISFVSWPTFDESKLVSDTIEVVFQVDGKVRAKVEAPVDISKEDMEKLAFEQENIQTQLENSEVARVIVVPGKLVNIVTK